MADKQTAAQQWLEEALTRYERPLLGFALRQVSDLETARDIVQECFLRLCREPREKVADHVGPWLFAVCRHRAIDHLRKDGRMRTHTNTELDLDAVDRQAAQEASAVVQAAAREEADNLLAHVAHLPPRQQEVVRLKFQAGLSYKQIGVLTKSTVGNVGFLLHTAIRNLRTRLGESVSPAPSGRST